MAASGDQTFERCRPRTAKRDSDTEFPVRKSTSEISESFPLVRRAWAEIENGLNYFRRSIASDVSETKPSERTEPIVVVAAADDEPPASPPPPMGLKERRGSRGSPCANLPPLMLPPVIPDPSPGRLSPNRLSPQIPTPKEPVPAPEVQQNLPRRSRTRSEMPPDPPPRSPQTPRPASVSPKHTFAFKIVLKKVESTPNTSFDRPEQ